MELITHSVDTGEQKNAGDVDSVLSPVISYAPVLLTPVILFTSVVDTCDKLFAGRESWVY